MASKKYVVRDGFVVIRKLVRDNARGEKETYERRHEAGDVVELDDEEAATHGLRIEFADEKDRNAALKAEQQKAAAAAPTSGAFDAQALASAIADGMKQAFAAMQTSAQASATKA